jgi:uncharacterized membrane protein YidH (DUF202 family)
MVHDDRLLVNRVDIVQRSLTPMAERSLVTARDSGLQRERTSLAWTRTALVFGLNAILVARAGIAGHHPELAWWGMELLFACGVIFAIGRKRSAKMAQDACPAAPSARVVASVSCLALIAVLGSAMAIIGHR